MRFAYLSLPLIVLGTIVASADDKTPPQAMELGPLVDPLARAVVCIDLKQANVSELLDLAAPEEVMAAYGHLPLVDKLQQGRLALLAAGIDRVYLVVSLADMPRCPWYLVGPCTRPLDPDALSRKLPDLAVPMMVRDELVPGAILRENSDPWFFLGAEAAYQRLQPDQPSARPELVATLAETDNSPVQVLLLPSDDDRSLIEELMPTLPEPLGGGPSTVLTRGFRWAVVRLHLEPEPAVQVVIQSADQEAARQFRELLVQGIEHINQGESHTDLAHVAERMPKLDGDRLVLNLRKSDGILAALHGVTTRPMARLAIEQTAKEQLKKIVLGMHRWYDAHLSLPRQASYDDAGKPLLSWRVHILSLLGDPYSQLYKKFHLDEPWDSEHNRKMLQDMPNIYVMPGSEVARDGRTCFVRPVGPGTACPPGKAIAIRDITDGTSNTVAVIEVDDEHAVPWTKPADLDYDPENPTKGLGGHLEGAVFSAFCDGAPYVHRTLVHDPKRIGDLRKVFTRADGEPVNFRE